MRVSAKALATLLLVVGGPSVSYAASGYLVWCSGCNSTQISNAVLTSGAGFGVTVYVGDPVSGAYAAYQKFSEIDDSHQPPTHSTVVQNVTGDSSVLNGVHAYIQFYQTAPVGWHKTSSVVYNGPDHLATGWTIANFGPNQANFNSWLNSTLLPGAVAAQFFGIGSQLTGGLIHSDASWLPTQTITITFPDGSTMTAGQNTQCGCLNVNPDSGLDAEGNPIPYLDSNGKLHNAGGVRRYQDTPQGVRDYNAYLNQISHFPIVLNLNSIQIGGGGHAGGSGGTQPVICTETDDENGNKEITCFQG